MSNQRRTSDLSLHEDLLVLERGLTDGAQAQALQQQLLQRLTYLPSPQAIIQRGIDVGVRATSKVAIQIESSIHRMEELSQWTRKTASGEQMYIREPVLSFVNPC